MAPGVAILAIVALVFYRNYLISVEKKESAISHEISGGDAKAAKGGETFQ